MNMKMDVHYFSFTLIWLIVILTDQSTNGQRHLIVPIPTTSGPKLFRILPIVKTGNHEPNSPSVQVILPQSIPVADTSFPMNVGLPKEKIIQVTNKKPVNLINNQKSILVRPIANHLNLLVPQVVQPGSIPIKPIPIRPKKKKLRPILPSNSPQIFPGPLINNPPITQVPITNPVEIVTKPAEIAEEPVESENLTEEITSGDKIKSASDVQLDNLVDSDVEVVPITLVLDANLMVDLAAKMLYETLDHKSIPEHLEQAKAKTVDMISNLKSVLPVLPESNFQFPEIDLLSPLKKLPTELGTKLPVKFRLPSLGLENVIKPPI